MKQRGVSVKVWETTMASIKDVEAKMLWKKTVILDQAVKALKTKLKMK